MRTLQATYNWASYLRWMCVSFLILIGTVGIVNIFIDPLGVFASPRIANVNAIKPYLDHHRELSRYQRAIRVCANTGIFGNSRAEIGFDPENATMRKQGWSAFNYAIPGTRASSSLQQLLWLKQQNCFPKNILLGIEFFDFLGGAAPQPLPTLQTASAPKRDVKFLSEAVFSITGLRDSLSTLALQRSQFPATTTARGFNPLFKYIAEVSQSGHYALFRQRAEENAQNWSGKVMQLHAENGGVSNDEAMLDAILARASNSGSTTYLIIYPYHAEIRLMIERMGMGQLFSDWKKIVVENAEKYAATGGAVEVWDFSGLAPETIETIPSKGDKQTQLTHYWEAGHFKKELGDLIIDRIIGKQNNFGIRLEKENIESWLQEDRHRVQTLLKSDAPLVREVDGLLARRKHK